MKKYLVLALGNDILGDDAVALHVLRRLRSEGYDCVEFEEATGGGLDLLDHLEGRECALLIDAICTGDMPPGTIREFDASEFTHAVSGSPHYVGLPEVLRLAAQMSIPIPPTLRILAMEVENAFDIEEGLSEAALGALPEMVGRAKEIVRQWIGEEKS